MKPGHARQGRKRRAMAGQSYCLGKCEKIPLSHPVPFFIMSRSKATFLWARFTSDRKWKRLARCSFFSIASWKVQKESFFNEHAKLNHTHDHKHNTMHQ